MFEIVEATKFKSKEYTSNKYFIEFKNEVLRFLVERKADFDFLKNPEKFFNIIFNSYLESWKELELDSSSIIKNIDNLLTLFRENKNKVKKLSLLRLTLLFSLHLTSIKDNVSFSSLLKLANKIERPKSNDDGHIYCLPKMKGCSSGFTIVSEDKNGKINPLEYAKFLRPSDIKERKRVFSILGKMELYDIKNLKIKKLENNVFLNERSLASDISYATNYKFKKEDFSNNLEIVKKIDGEDLEKIDESLKNITLENPENFIKQSVNLFVTSVVLGLLDMKPENIYFDKNTKKIIAGDPLTIKESMLISKEIFEKRIIGKEQAISRAFLDKNNKNYLDKIIDCYYQKSFFPIFESKSKLSTDESLLNKINSRVDDNLFIKTDFHKILKDCESRIQNSDDFVFKCIVRSLITLANILIKEGDLKNPEKDTQLNRIIYFFEVIKNNNKFTNLEERIKEEFEKLNNTLATRSNSPILTIKKSISRTFSKTNFEGLLFSTSKETPSETKGFLREKVLTYKEQSKKLDTMLKSPILLQDRNIESLVRAKVSQNYQNEVKFNTADVALEKFTQTGKIQNLDENFHKKELSYIPQEVKTPNTKKKFAFKCSTDTSIGNDRKKLILRGSEDEAMKGFEFHLEMPMEQSVTDIMFRVRKIGFQATIEELKNIKIDVIDNQNKEIGKNAKEVKIRDFF